jgi:hypothetical protein
MLACVSVVVGGLCLLMFSCLHKSAIAALLDLRKAGRPGPQQQEALAIAIEVVHSVWVVCSVHSPNMGAACAP